MCVWYGKFVIWLKGSSYDYNEILTLKVYSHASVSQSERTILKF